MKIFRRKVHQNPFYKKFIRFGLDFIQRKLSKTNDLLKKLHKNADKISTTGFLITVFFIICSSSLSTASHNSIASDKTVPQHSDPYKILTSFQLSSPRAEVVELEHRKSGARLILVKNSDPARTFTVSFRTPPYDDTGLFHIFEHAVTKGSRLYPSKSNFNRVVSSTLASHANAYTGAVTTYYPFVTKDPKDFDNLLAVYMDSVFFPKVLEDPRIVKREGWRYEVNPQTKEMSINGIVFNEMKGVFANPYKNLLFHLNRSVLPQTPYSYSSGGLPEKVATLRFEQIVKAHKKYYHPQNSMIYLYGNIDYEKTLATIDREFLSHFERTPGFTPDEIALQTNPNYPSDVVQATYPGFPHKDILAKTYVLGPMTSIQEDAAYILISAFASTFSSPLRHRIFSEGVAQSVLSTKLEGRDNAYSFIFQGTKTSELVRLGEILNEELDKVINQGLDQELLTSILNSFEISYKDKYSNGSHRGLALGESVRYYWLFPDQPLEQKLDIAKTLRELRELLQDENFVRDFFRKHIRDNNHSRWLVMRADPQFSQKFNEAIKRQIEEALRIKPLEEYEKEDRIYQQWAKAEEPPEIANKTPVLELSDITVDEQLIPFNKSKMGSTQIIEYPQETSGISYVKLFFDLRGVKEEDLKNLKLFTSLLGKTDTTHFTHQELSKQKGIHTGGIKFQISTYRSVKDPEEFKPTLFVKLTFLDENSEQGFSLLEEILKESQFSPLEHVDQLVREKQLGIANSLSSEGVKLALGAATRNLFPEFGAFKDETKGVGFREYMMNTEIDPEHLSSRLKKMAKDIFNQNRFYLATITGEQDGLKKLGTKLEQLKSSLPVSEDSPDQIWTFSNQKTYDGFALPGEVQHNVEVISLRDQGLEYHGSMDVYSQYLNTHFMFPRLREQGGAYVAEAYVSRHLFALITSRDPHLQQTFDIFAESTGFMENRKPDKEELKPSILGAIKSYYSDTSISERTGLITGLHLADQTWDDYLETKREILNTTPEDIQKLNEILDSAFGNSTKSVAGNPKKIREEAPFLKNVMSFQ